MFMTWYRFSARLRAFGFIFLNFNDLSQPLPLLMLSKLMRLHGDAKLYFFTVSCVLESELNYF